MADEDMMEEFVVDQETPEEQWLTFLRFIERVRRRLTGTQFTHGLPVLPEERAGRPSRWLNILLRASQLSIRLRIRNDNLYLMGYQLHNSNQWLELGHEGDTQLIDNSNFIGFRHNYPDLINETKTLKPTPIKSVNDIQLGQEQLIKSIVGLNEATTNAARAYHLLVMMHMICEAIRSAKISNYIATLFGLLRGSVRPPPWMYNFTHGWATCSKILHRADSDAAHFRPPTNSMGLVTILDVVAALAMVKYFCFRPPRRSLLLDMNAYNSYSGGGGGTTDDEQCLLGQPLVEVFGVYVTDIDKEETGELYGTVSIRGGLISQYLYSRTRDNYESIKPGNTALLNGPVEAVWAYDSFSINVDLMDKDVMSSDDQVSKGEFFWNLSDNLYDTPLDHDVGGEYGSVTVRYIVFRDAVEATVEVTLIDGDKEDPADVYGLLTARTTNFANESVLFRKSSSERINVRPGDLIPLSRCVVAVPCNSSLIVTADIWDWDRLSDDQIAKGTAEFAAHLSGSYEKHIKGPCGDIKVKVTWSNDS